MADTVTLLLKGDHFLACSAVIPTAAGLTVTDLDGRTLDFPIGYVERVMRGSPNIDAKAVDSLAEQQHSDIALLILHVEHAWERFQTQTSAHGLPRAALFGSASLALTILPANTSHDADIAVNEEFAPFVADYIRRAASIRTMTLQPEITRWDVFQHIPNWEKRASHISGLPVDILIPHPLDTISQKLLRIDSSAFERDHRHIKEVMEILRPSREQMLGLLQEGASRYTDLVPEQAKAARDNTSWFLRDFFPDADLERDVIQPAIRVRRGELTKLGVLITPLPNLDWKQTPGFRL